MFRPDFRVFAVFLACTLPLAATPIVHSDFVSLYTLTDLGPAPNVPGETGGLVFRADNPDSLLLGGNANTRRGAIYEVPLTRDAAGHVTGFAGDASLFANAYGTTGGIDGALLYAPNGTLLYTSYPDNHVGQIKPGSTEPDKVSDLTSKAGGVATSVGGMQFVPAGFPGAGRVKFGSYSVGRWFDGIAVPDGSGTYDFQITPSDGLFIGGDLEGILYVPAGTPGFIAPTVLINDFKYSELVAFDLDANGDPVVATRRTVVAELGGAEGITRDPVTGDIFLSTFGFRDHVFRLSAIADPSGDEPAGTPEPGTAELLVTGVALILVRYLRR